ncbi:hypothetical protein HO133_002360 [Letharia lupina]|uniref:DUF7025 domain-containing protein n=1 Tax=Letharia lupina TaxID=560253 RepID=A0A8H6CDN0_9LECA|nr:uncharacterized protein HO133_002360 [Letharia lupina]KAF6221504.1 hypothetical protein HO133_002360 [Letharia lupina]
MGQEGARGPVLYANSPLKNVQFHLERHPEIAFIFYKGYDQSPPADNSKRMSKDGVYRIPEPSKQTLVLNSEHLISAVERLGGSIPDFANFFPNFDPDREIPAPYIAYSPAMAKTHVAAKRRAAKGMVSRRLVKYLVRPGDVLVRTQDAVPHAYVATTWAKEGKPDREGSRKSEEGRPLTLNAEKKQGPRKRTYKFEVAAWSWAFDGSFERKRTTIKIQLNVSVGERYMIDIDTYKTLHPIFSAIYKPASP